MTCPDVTASMDSCEEYTCSCLRRQHEPPMPTFLPNGLGPTEDNVELLKNGFWTTMVRQRLMYANINFYRL